MLVWPATSSFSAAPLLYRQPAYQSPIRGEPDDLLLIPGYGFDSQDVVVYRAVEGAYEKLQHPREVPRSNSATLGTADIVSRMNIPYSLTVRLPKIMHERQAYALWVVSASHEWSEPVRINDARPLWLSPAFVYASAHMASLDRYIKVVGRNLEPARQATTQIRLSGPADVVLNAQPAAAEESALDHYAAVAPLPARLVAGTYRVAIKRDRSGWVDLPGQSLEVYPDPPRATQFDVGAPAYGGCQPDDGRDDVRCVAAAIAAAEAAGGGTVKFGPGTWNLSGLPSSQADGIIVPRGVNLRGAGSRETIILQEADETPERGRATFTLLGGNTVEGLTFRDAHVYTLEDADSTFIRLGRSRREGLGTPPDAVLDVVITKNLFDRPNVAIKDGGSPIKRLFVTDNEFGAYRSALELAGNRFLVNERFGVEDSVIAHNLFKPGSYLATKMRQGTMASEVGASFRVDFSHNVADGAATDRLYAVEDAPGWRAAFFWHMNNNQEMLLVSQNVATCTGDKDGDGEAIAYDNNANTFALPHAGIVLRASSDSVTIAGPMAARQNDRDIRIGNYYQGHWIQVGEGPGLGQVRKIREYTEDPNTGMVMLRVAPDWDVVPAVGDTRINIGREFWQVYTVDNLVDHRKPLCKKSNRTKPQGGVIGSSAQMADSAIEGNRQYDTDGIIFRQHYNAEEPSCPACARETMYVDSFEIRGNLIDGEYAWDDDCSSSGIFGAVTAGPTRAAPTTVSYGVSISHNQIVRADGRRGAAISLMPTWYEGPPPNRWPLVDNILIHHNSLRGLDSGPPRFCAGAGTHPRTAISLGASALVWRSVLYSNSCPDARRPLDIRDPDVVRVCSAHLGPTCECPQH